MMVEEKGIATKHGVLVDKAKYAIDQVFTDISVDSGKTRESLETLRQDIDDYLMTLDEEREQQE